MTEDLTMTALLLEDPAADLLVALRNVQGVARAALEPDPTGAGGPGLLRLELTPGAAEVAVATRVGHVLRQQFTLSVDTAHLTLVESFGSVGPADLRCGRTTLTSGGGTVAVSTSVSTAEPGSAHGRASGPMTNGGTVRAVAEAVLDAAAGLAQLPGVSVTSATTGADAAGVRRAVVVLAAPSGPVQGSSVVLTDVRQAVVRATLEAIRPLLGCA